MVGTRGRFRGVIILLTISLSLLSRVSCSVAFGSVRGTISGTIRDNETMEALPSVHVCVAGTEFTAWTDDSGQFVIPLVPSGEYTVLMSLSGYADITCANVLIKPERSTALNIRLRRLPAPRTGRCPAHRFE